MTLPSMRTVAIILAFAALMGLTWPVIHGVRVCLGEGAEGCPSEIGSHHG